MRISIVNINLVDADAVGNIIAAQLEYFEKRGDFVKVYVSSPLDNSRDALADHVVFENPTGLIERDAHFGCSDLYIFHYPVYYPLLEIMGGIRHGVVWLYYHNVTPAEYASNEDLHQFLRKSKQKVPYFANLSDYVVTPSPYNQQVLQGEHGIASEKVRVLPNFVSSKEFYPGPKPERLLHKYNLQGRSILLFTGRFAANKQLPELIQILSNVKRSLDSVALILVGDNKSNLDLISNRDKVEELIGNLDLEDDVIITGRVDNIGDYFRLADLYVTASTHEGFGVPLVEALFSGTPIVASDIPPHAWILGKCGEIFDIGHPEQAAESILKLLQDRKLYGERVQMGFNQAESFAIENYFSRLHMLVAESMETVPSRVFLDCNEDSFRSINSTHETSPESQAVGDEDYLANINMLRSMAPLVDTSYTMTSNIPVLGSLLSRFRWFVSRQLKVGYIDPKLRRQEEFNNKVIEMLEKLASKE